MKIKICENYPKQNKFIKKLTLNYPTAKIEVRPCIGMCKHCKTKAAAVVDGKKMKKKTIKKFITELEKKKK